jgi:hypothetical protein
VARPDHRERASGELTPIWWK